MSTIFCCLVKESDLRKLLFDKNGKFYNDIYYENKNEEDYLNIDKYNNISINGYDLYKTDDYIGQYNKNLCLLSTNALHYISDYERAYILCYYGVDNGCSFNQVTKLEDLQVFTKFIKNLKENERLTDAVFSIYTFPF